MCSLFISSCRQCFTQEIETIANNISSRNLYQRTGVSAMLTTSPLHCNDTVYYVISTPACQANLKFGFDFQTWMVSMCIPEFIHPFSILLHNL